MILREFKNFLLDVAKEPVSDDVKRIGNIILNNLSEISHAGTASGKRSKIIIKYAQNDFESISSELTMPSEFDEQDDFEIKSLKSIEIESFRGFIKKEIFDLDSPVVLLYGPNGSGKTSFCEALEYSLLGSLEEAEVNRFRNINDYIKNARRNNYKNPKLLAVNEQGDICAVSPNDELYRFCFIEKNRIDAFSRMAARAPAQQDRLIGTLFGLESFDEFVRGFSDELNPKYIVLSGEKEFELWINQSELRNNQSIISSAKDNLKALSISENRIASEFREGMSFSDFVKYVGTPENPGKIQELENILKKRLPQKIGLSLSSLNQIDITLHESKDIIDKIVIELERKKSLVSFRNLYTAVIELNIENSQICPACSTSLNEVKINPYVQANTGLQDLKHLSILEEELMIEKNRHQQSLVELFDFIRIVSNFNQLMLKDKVEVYDIPNAKNEMTTEWWLSSKNNKNDEVSVWDKIIHIINKIEDFDKYIEFQESKRDTILNELISMRDYREIIVRNDEKRENLNESIKNAEEDITNFEIKNIALIEAVKSERHDIEINLRIASAYKIFVQKLDFYRNALPKKLISDLENIIKELYNKFNNINSDGDLLASIHLPLESGNKIEISFISNPFNFYDALHVLSDGHIRCLGLAILLAKNIKQKCPILVLDDPVNAIDDNHREGIRRTLFNKELFTDTQIILTCHGEEFIKDIQHHLNIRKTKIYEFIPHNDNNQIQVISYASCNNVDYAYEEDDEEIVVVEDEEDS